MLPLAVHIALALGFAESLGLAGLLWLRAGKVPGIGYLALFLLIVVLGIAGVVSVRLAASAVSRSSVSRGSAAHRCIPPPGSEALTAGR